MKHKAIEQILQRADLAKSDSDYTYFFTLMLVGEALAKTVVLALLRPSMMILIAIAIASSINLLELMELVTGAKLLKTL